VLCQGAVREDRRGSGSTRDEGVGGENQSRSTITGSWTSVKWHAIASAKRSAISTRATHVTSVRSVNDCVAPERRKAVVNGRTSPLCLLGLHSGAA
jgi:hypothetical protein